MAELSLPKKEAKLLLPDKKIKYTIVVSNDNQIFSLHHETSTITCVGQSDSLQPYSAFHHVNESEYLFAKMDENGDTVIVHQDGQGNEKSHPSKDFFSLVNMEKVKANMKVKYYTTEGIISFRLSSGGPLGKIKRTTHFIHSSGWELICPVFEVDDETIQVKHSLSDTEFLNLCLECKGYKTPEGASLRDLNVHLWKDEIKISPMNPDVFVNNGLHGGLYSENPASIHILRSSVNMYQRCQYLRKLSTSPHKNVQEYFDMKKDGDRYLFAFEPVQTSLDEYMRFVKVDGFKPQFIDVLRGIIEGLIHIHTLGLSHGNIQPWNTYVQNGLFKFGGYNDWSPLTDESRENDYDLVARLIGWIFSCQKITVSKDEYLTFEMNMFKRNMNPLSREAHQVVEMLTGQNRDDGLLERILLEPWLWKADRRIVYYKEIQEVLYDRHKTYKVDTSGFQSKVSRCWDRNNSKGWGACFDDVLMVEFNSKSEYTTTSAEELIRFVRNLYGHHLQFGGDMVARHKFKGLGRSIEALEYHIRKAVPELLKLLYEEVRRQKLHTSRKLKSFYEEY